MYPTKWPHQTTFGAGEGNCFATCVATLLGLEVDAVPNFCLKETWLGDAVDWLQERGWGVVYVYDRTDRNSNLPESTAVWSTLPQIVTGKSPRGEHLHCVLRSNDDKTIHDPHPDGLGIEGPIRDRIVLFPLPNSTGRKEILRVIRQNGAA